MTETNDKCAHPPCNCMVDAEGKYCSQYCEAAGPDEVEISCDCGHSGCGLTQ